MFRFKVPAILPRIVPSATWKVKSSEPVLYLSFDDGPHPDITAWVAETLQSYGARATFFCVGENVQKYTPVYQMLLQQGHSTGNHTWHHLSGWAHSTDEYLRDVARCASLVKSKLFRPPYGRISPGQLRLLKKDYQVVMWSLLSCDYDARLSVPAALKALKNAVEPGSILVFHDSVKAEKNLKKMLPELLDDYSNRGFRFECL